MTSGATSDPPRIRKLAIAVTFHFAPDRLQWLERIAREFPLLADQVDLHIVCNRGDDEVRSLIGKALAGAPHTLVVPTLLGHPFLLTWVHLAVFRTLFAQDPDITHFLYLEDDILIEPRNVAYWLRGRDALRPHGFIPSFIRYEINHADGLEYSSDVVERHIRSQLPTVPISPDYAYLSLRQPYQGMYLMDRELMEEHLNGPSSSPDFGPWPIREKAAQGLTFTAVPKGFFARNLVGFDLTANALDRGCLIHHLPDNYANSPVTFPYGKVAIRDMLTLQPVKRPLYRRVLGKVRRTLRDWLGP